MLRRRINFLRLYFYVGDDEMQAYTKAQNVLTTPSAAILVTTTSPNLDVSTLKELALDVSITAITGTTPTYQLMIDRLGLDGVWYTIYTGTSITAIAVISLSIGASLVTNIAFAGTIRLREVVGGTTPSITRSMSIIGK
jgi:hypothetical protein